MHELFGCLLQFLDRPLPSRRRTNWHAAGSANFQPSWPHASLCAGSLAVVASELGQTAWQFTYSWYSTCRRVLTYT